MGKTVEVYVEKHEERTSKFRDVDARALVEGFLAKLPDPRLAKPKVVHEISPVDKLLREVAESLVINCSGVSYVRANVDVDDLTNPAFAIFATGHTPNDQHEGSIFVYQKLEGTWIDKTPPDDKFGHKHCLKVQCGDDLNTTLTIQKSDPMWINLILYPNDDMCQAWIGLKLLLHKQDGSAITSLMQSKDGPVRGHTVRITRSVENAVGLIESQLTQWISEEVRRAAV